MWAFYSAQLGGQQSYSMHNSLLGIGIGIATLVILMLAVLACLLDQRLSVETAKVEVLRQSEERFRSLVQNASDIIAVVAADGSVCYTSLSVKQILGYEPEDWLGKKAFEFVHPDDLAKAENLLTEALQCSATNMTLDSLGSEPIDAKTLQSLRQMAGDRATEVLDQLIDNYLAEAPQLLQAMHAAVATKDAAALLQAAQTLRSASANVGATSVCQLCKALEAIGGAGTTAGVLASVLQVEAAYATAKAALQIERQRV
jgi:HPt (histidine-containing phosphotransfer) domain-containing protein